MIQNNKIKERIYYLDIARGFAILGMFAQHCMVVHEVSGGEGASLLANVFVLLGTAPSAPVFMLLMGAFLMKSSASIEKSVWRGLKLLLLGYGLNFLRFTLPLLLAKALTAGNTPIELTGETPLELLFCVDIFQLAGLSLIFCAGMRKIAVKKYGMPFLLVMILLVSPFLWGQFEGHPAVALLWGTGSNVFFPFFPWVIYPLLGMYLSPYLTGVHSPQKLLKKMRWYGLGLFVLGLGVILLNGFKLFGVEAFPIGDYFRSGAGIHLLMVGFVLAWFSVCFGFEQRFGADNPIASILIYWSKQVTAMYFIQWVLFGWSILLFDANQQTAFASALIGLAVLVITHLLVKQAGVRKLFAWV